MLIKKRKDKRFSAALVFSFNEFAALRFLKCALKDPDFENSKVPLTFCFVINGIFNVVNSKNKFNKVLRHTNYKLIRLC